MRCRASPWCMPTSTASTHAGELTELGVDEAAENAVVLLEWPDRAADALPPDRLDIAFTLAPHLGPNQRQAELTAHGAFVPRLERLAAIRQFLAAEGLADAPRTHVQGDASTPLLRAPHARGPQAHPDERAAPAGRTAGARRPALQRDRASRRGREAVRRDGARVARARPVGAAGPCGRSQRRTAAAGGSRHRRRGRGRSAGADRGALCGRGRRAGRDAPPAGRSARCRSRRASTTACRPTTSMRS